MGAPSLMTSEAPFELSQHLVVEGFSLSVYSTPESFKEKFLLKTCKNPMVPIGCLGTVAALTHDLYCFPRDQSQCCQLMIYNQIATQGFSLTATLLDPASSAVKSLPKPGLVLKAPWRLFPAWE
ncbi:HIG1 domain family member 2A-like [Equus quagga]|uniref:HIG1 domain family member 2A-like n=1 Tax=Equus quagga TaxID=89248 RepID=UPI001EE38315|nr:HIG1 domain family member 2A-like [Equus quagga]